MIVSPQKYLFIITTVVVLLLAAGIITLVARQSVEQPPSRLTIATTIFPLADIARNIAGEDVYVIQLLPPGASPHSYNLSPQQLTDINNAKVLFVIGHKLDAWAADAITRATEVPIVTVDEGIKLREFEAEDEHHEGEEGDEHEETGTDPHYWLTIPNGQQIATTIAQTLQEIDPINSEVYASNLIAYTEELATVEKELQLQARSAKHTEFIAVHNAWSYLAQQYGFELAAAYEPVAGKEPSISDIQRLQKLVSEHNIGAFYNEPAEHSIGATRFFQDNLGLSVKTLDDIGGIPPRDTYINLMRENIRALSE
ncbi:MAG: zinc ABC transporter substrate-binding protein [Candidatus Andersenbacteria bacterium]|nr:zinc ABC transporter substrate-binding protein [Candidatus Andersenbacteria bacterium]MBI3251229.1 zinc ABC transporter substrate-binding protein [Candidatus Andersenbacteria bacterium]